MGETDNVPFFSFYSILLPRGIESGQLVELDKGKSAHSTEHLWRKELWEVSCCHHLKESPGESKSVRICRSTVVLTWSRQLIVGTVVELVLSEWAQVTDGGGASRSLCRGRVSSGGASLSCPSFPVLADDCRNVAQLLRWLSERGHRFRP